MKPTTNQAFVRMHASQLKMWIECTPKPKDRELSRYWRAMHHDCREFEARIQKLKPLNEDAEDVMFDEIGPMHSDLDEAIRNAPTEEHRQAIIQGIRMLIAGEFKFEE